MAAIQRQAPLAGSQRAASYDSMLKRSKKRFKDRFYQMRGLGLLPDIPAREGSDPYFTDHVSTDAEFDALPPAGIDAVLLTHAHHDHDGNVPYLSPRISLFGTPETLCFFEQKYWAIDEDRLVFFGDDRRITISPIRVDHSIPGACGYLIETAGGTSVAISGDFRLYGTHERRALSERFIGRVRARGPVDLLIVEGTNIDEFSDAVEEARGGWSVKAFIKAEAERAFAAGGMVVVGVSENNACVLERLRMTGAFSGGSDAGGSLQNPPRLSDRAGRDAACPP